MSTRPRSLWNGTIAFGEVAIPVKLFAASASAARKRRRAAKPRPLILGRRR